jgi:putative nucleotidyltransferase with HDIG domain
MSSFSINPVNLMHTMTLALDLAVDGVNMHQQRTAVICKYIAEQIGMKQPDKQTLLCAALMHDIGAAPYLEERRLIYSAYPHDDKISIYRHAEDGYQLLLDSQCFSHTAEAVRHHHDRWQGGNPSGFSGADIPLFSRIIHVADRAEISMHTSRPTSAQCEMVCENIRTGHPGSFDQDVVDAFMASSRLESFWLDMNNTLYAVNFHNNVDWSYTSFTDRDMLNIAKLYSTIIDRTSRFTATHSRSVSRVAALLADLYGFSRQEVYLMRMAGLLHDLGKLSVPNAILEKPGKLDPDEVRIIRQHTYYTYRILEQIDNMETVACWAAYHHETLDGKGYPFHLRDEQLSLGSRIMAVADIFVALTENRPYRKPMKMDKVEKIMRTMADSNKISGRIVELMMDARDTANCIVRDADSKMLEALGQSS